MTIRPRQLADFEGQWQLSREIVHADGTRATLEGQAVWTPGAQGSRYLETGALQIGSAAPVMARREYAWSADLSVYFDDRRFFHRVPALGGPASHWCAPDQYEGVYDFTTWPELRVSWQVTGPRKSYRMNSTYRPWSG